jgi:transcriptional antiterminator NusG
MTDTIDNSNWYVIHTYSGYENKVKANIEKIVENRGMQDQVLEVAVPVEEVLETEDNKKKIVLRKIYPGYVIVRMVMTDESWHLVRNTRGVTGFVGPGSKPIPLTEEEVKAMGVELQSTAFDFEVGDNVKVVSGPLENFIGVVEEINLEKKKIKVMVSMFGRETPVELEFNQVSRLV